jgi:tRNA-2-methylthio-N6-dimethylallyladenosine synthase
VLVERDSSKSDQEFCGRNSQNSMCVFPKKEGLKPGDYVMVKIRDANSATLLGDVV